MTEHCEINSLRRYQLHLEDKMDTQVYFMMSHVPEEKRLNLEYIHFDQVSIVYYGVLINFTFYHQSVNFLW